jgi:hypothetical protein
MCEIPDRNSPENFPEALIVTAKEIRNAIEEHMPTTQPAADLLEPVAWMYEHDGMLYYEGNPPIVVTKRWSICEEPWNERPLYALPEGYEIVRRR